MADTDTKPTTPTPSKAPTAPTAAAAEKSHKQAYAVAAVAGLVLVALIVFLASNDQRVKVSFVGLDGHSSLAVALLAAAFGGAATTVLAWGAWSLHRRRAQR